MAENYHVTLLGRPVPKARPRMTRSGGVYTPKTTVDFEKAIGNAWFDKYGETKLEGMIKVWIYFCTDRHGKQDVDNLAKSVLDGLQRANCFATGDEQVYELTASKYPGDTLQTPVCLRVMEEYALPD